MNHLFSTFKSGFHIKQINNQSCSAYNYYSIYLLKSFYFCSKLFIFADSLDPFFCVPYLFLHNFIFFYQGIKLSVENIFLKMYQVQLLNELFISFCPLQFMILTRHATDLSLFVFPASSLCHIF